MFKLIFWSTTLASLVALFTLPLKTQLIIYVAINAILWALCFLPPLVYPTRDLPMGAHGLALPGLILIRPESPQRERIIAHEYTHIRQLRRWSPLGLSLYMGWYYSPVLTGPLRGQRGGLARFIELYRANPLEAEANRAMSEAAPYRVIFSRRFS
jgi:hypothetical protein